MACDPTSALVAILAWLGKAAIYDPWREAVADKREKAKKATDAARVRRLSAVELCNEPLDVLKEYENDISLHIYLTDWRDERALARLDEVRAAISWHEIGGERPSPFARAAAPLQAAPEPVRLTRVNNTPPAVLKQYRRESLRIADGRARR